MDLFGERAQKMITGQGNSSNGRLDIKGPMKNDIFQLYDKIALNHKSSSYTEALTGSWDPNSLSRAFFCSANIRIVQNAIRAGVHKGSNGRYNIGDQNEDTLKIIMRSTFLSSAVNNPEHIKEQIQELNKLVIKYCVPQLLGECEGYIKFKHDVSTLATPIDRPISTYHSNSLQTKTFF
jgi:hypothetical protein